LTVKSLGVGVQLVPVPYFSSLGDVLKTIENDERKRAKSMQLNNAVTVVLEEVVGTEK